ncbi:MAG: PAS domain-containing sensor histidine kinase [Adhaeribacter sp.]
MPTHPFLPAEALKVFESVPDLYLILSPDLVILTASDAYLKATLTRREEVTGRHLFEVFPDNPLEKNSRSVTNLEASLHQVLATGKPHRMAIQHYDVPDGQNPGGGFAVKYWLPLNTPVLDEQGQVAYIIHKVEEVTELVCQLQQGEYPKHKNPGLPKAKQRPFSPTDGGLYGKDLSATLIRYLDMYRLVVEHTPDVITRWDQELRLTFANPAFEQRTGVPNSRQLGKTKSEMGQPEPIAGPWMAKLRQVFDTGRPIEHYNMLQTTSGPTFYFTRMAPELAPDHSVISVLAIARDITEIKNLEEENLAIRIDQQNKLLLAILEAQEQERSRISESLHNGVGQILFATKLNLRESQKMLPPGSPASQALQASQELLAQAIHETREASHELVPALLQEFGLKDALLDLCNKYDRKALQINCQVTGFSGRLAPLLETALFRICQELINNIARHAQASTGDLKLWKQGDQILLQVRDNGKGFAYEAGKMKGLGLKSIDSRVRLLNGTLEVGPADSQTGTLVKIKIPVPAFSTPPAPPAHHSTPAGKG